MGRESALPACIGLCDVCWLNSVVRACVRVCVVAAVGPSHAGQLDEAVMHQLLPLRTSSAVFRKVRWEQRLCSLCMSGALLAGLCCVE